MRKGGILLSVHADDQESANKGELILEQTGAEDIASTGESNANVGNADRPAVPSYGLAPAEQLKIVKR